MTVAINIDTELLDRLREDRTAGGEPASKVVEDALREYLAIRKSNLPATRIELPTSRTDMGLRPGVNLDSNASITDMLDEEYAEKLRDTARR